MVSGDLAFRAIAMILADNDFLSRRELVKISFPPVQQRPMDGKWRPVRRYMLLAGSDRRSKHRICIQPIVV
jgi:hypothetical protein